MGSNPGSTAFPGGNAIDVVVETPVKDKLEWAGGRGESLLKA